ncbi:hypothetical protein RhiJN_01816 [Ceratobasidium sp. AG-Ba]|nr:hypothetical protein RhiJN_01816 [Ceratobasidium sp. AG-Ba]QRW02751.1 hypothetical protein RhiLY_01750 [Ceratobasidium sp. AG-Ba]
MSRSNNKESGTPVPRGTKDIQSPPRMRVRRISTGTKDSESSQDVKNIDIADSQYHTSDQFKGKDKISTSSKELVGEVSEETLVQYLQEVVRKRRYDPGHAQNQYKPYPVPCTSSHSETQHSRKPGDNLVSSEGAFRRLLDMAGAGVDSKVFALEADTDE